MEVSRKLISHLPLMLKEYEENDKINKHSFVINI